MNFEKLGRIFFMQMRPLFFFVLCAIPLIIAALFLYSQHAKLEELETRFAAAARKEKLALERKARKETFLERYSHADPYFLDQKIESFLLLESERARLDSLMHHSAFPESPSIQERLEFLNKNRFRFTEENIVASTDIKEVDEKQRHPVQMDETDLKKILSLIEDLPIDSALPSNDSPQILIKEFRLKKKQTSLQTEIFEVEMDLLKREFTKS